MPVARYQMPDGRIARFEVPEGTTPEQAQASISEHYNFADPTEAMSTLDKLRAGMGKAFVDVGRGARQVMSNIPGVNQIGFYDPVAVQRDVDEARRLDAPLMKTGAGQVGNVLGNVAMTVAAPTSLPASIATGATLGALQPTAEGESRLLNTGLGAAGGAVGKVVGDKVAQGATTLLNKAQGAMATRAAQNAERDAVLEASQRAGYVVPPATVNPNIATKTLESVGGKVATAQDASLKNQEVTNTLARRALGLADDAPMSRPILAKMREDAGQAYQAVKDFGAQVNLRFKPDQQLAKDVADIGAGLQSAQKTYPSIFSNADIAALKTDLMKAASPADIIEAVKQLRSSASANFKAFDQPEKLALARAQRDAAEALDNFAERQLTASGQPNLAADYQAARMQIAKIHDVETAMKKKGGNVDANVLAAINERKGTLTDELATIADFASTFQKAAVTPGKIGSAGVHAARTGLGMLAGYENGGLEGAGVGGLVAGVMLPGAVRTAILSRAGQSVLANPSYAVNPLARIGAPTVNALGRYVAPGAAATYAYRSLPAYGSEEQ